MKILRMLQTKVERNETGRVSLSQDASRLPGGIYISGLACYFPSTVNSNFLTLRTGASLICLTAGTLALSACRHVEPVADACPPPAKIATAAPTAQPALAARTDTNHVLTSAASNSKSTKVVKRFNYIPRPYPVDERGFSPVDKALAKAYAREDMVTDDADGSLNPYVLKVISGFPTDGSYPYHCSWEPREYDIYNGVTQDMWYKGMVVAKAYPDGSRCSYCCGYTFEVFLRAMKLRNVQKGLDPDDFNGMTFNDLFNMLQLWYIEGKGASEQRGIVSYGLGKAITDLEQVKPGDFLSYSTTPPGGHSVIFIDWIRDDQKKIVGFKYFSSNLSGTHGVGYGQGRFSDSNSSGRGILRKSVKIGRVTAVADYVKFDRTNIPQRNAYAPTQPDRVVYLPTPTPETPASAPPTAGK
jgi:hypothetical protein